MITTGQMAVNLLHASSTSSYVPMFSITEDARYYAVP